MKLTKDEQKVLQSALARPFGRAELSLDGHRIQVRRVWVSESKTALLVYINGELGSEGLGIYDQVPVIFRQVWRTRSRAFYSPTEVKQLVKRLGKRRAVKIIPTLYERRHFLDPCFTTAASLVRQYAKLEGLELVKAEGVM